MPKIISTIVDGVKCIDPFQGLYAKNNFYYCRSEVVPVFAISGYMPKIISTIVDIIVSKSTFRWLYAKNNFYYCRWVKNGSRGNGGYMPKIISTIVDRFGSNGTASGYMPKIISTIVDLKACFRQEKGLYAKNNFYYCRYEISHAMYV